MLLYYITDRSQFPGGSLSQRSALLRRITEAARSGVDLIQLREKDLTIASLEQLAREAVSAVRDHSSTTRLLINSRIDVALAAGADGVHLTSTDIAASEVRAIHASSSGMTSGPRPFTVAVSCHSVAEVRKAESHGADFVVLAPIFEKAGTDAHPLGLELLRSAARGAPVEKRVEAGDNRGRIPILALGGVNLNNAESCLRAGAAGIAAIRLFQEGNLAHTVTALRELGSAAERPSGS